MTRLWHWLTMNWSEARWRAWARQTDPYAGYRNAARDDWDAMAGLPIEEEDGGSLLVPLIVCASIAIAAFCAGYLVGVM